MPIERAWSGYSCAHLPVMKTVDGTFSLRSDAISPGLSKCSPPAARRPWSAVMSASNVSATTLSDAAAPSRPAARRSKTGVRPPGPGASTGGPLSGGRDGEGDAAADFSGAVGRTAVPARVASGLAQPASAPPMTVRRIIVRTDVITGGR